MPSAVQLPGSGQQAVPGLTVQDGLPDGVPESMSDTMPDTMFGYDPRATAQWAFSAVADPDVPVPNASGEPPQNGGDLTGQWTIPVAAGEVPEESGEFATSSLMLPATLPGGAPAPWALPQEAQPEAEPERAGVTDESSRLHEAGADESRADAAEAEHARAGDDRSDDAYGNGTPPDGAPVPQHEPDPVSAPVVAGGDFPDPPAHGPDAGIGAAAEARTRAAHSEHPPASYVLRVNGSDRPVTDAWIGESLLYVLRERLGLAGAKDGCSQGECGACNVQVDGRLVASCLVPAATAAGSEVRTVEGLAVDGEPSDVQRALAECGAVQCGFCVPAWR